MFQVRSCEIGKSEYHSNGYSTINYKVQRGDNLIKLSKMFRVSRKDIENCNNLKSSNRIFVGQKLLLPIRVINYQVKRGDYLSQIAQRNKIKLKLLKKINNIHGSKIYRGQKILIPLLISNI